MLCPQLKGGNGEEEEDKGQQMCDHHPQLGDEWFWIVIEVEEAQQHPAGRQTSQT